MNAKMILGFLREVMANNNRTWFAAHRADYEAAKAEFEEHMSYAIARIATFDPTIAHITVKDATYRFYRDTRFSKDKSPYKNHMGAYIAAHGKKALHGGYYIHLEPGNCMLACGNYYLPTNILNACRNEIEGNREEWKRCVENKAFKKLFSYIGDGPYWMRQQGFGQARLKTCPAGFDRNSEMIDYLRMKDFCCWHGVPDTFYDKPDWMDYMEEVFLTAKPAMDFINNVIDDYE